MRCAFVVLAACHARPATLLAEAPTAVRSRLARDGHLVDARLGDGAVRYLGFTALPEGAFPGDEITLLHYWVAERAVPEDYRVFVHFLVAGARGLIPHGDHDPIPATHRWPVGTVVRDEHRVALPGRLPGSAVELRLGLYRGEHRMPVDAAHDDGESRVRAGAFAVSGTPVPVPTYRAPRLPLPPRLDGRIDAAEWRDAPVIPAFTESLGRAPAGVQTRARIAWDAEHLYLAFDCDDPDIIATHAERDAPIYREEAVEIFIDPRGTKRDYVELELSPRGTQLDAAFRGGPRRNMDLAYDARYRAAVAVDGTIEAGRGAPADTDRGWRSEWAIEAASIRGLATPLRAGTTLRINLFRVAKDRRGGRTVPDESAWSPPLMGDFHNLERFGELTLVP